MARVNLRGRGSTGVVAIWTGEDDDPYFNPLDNLASGRVKFHSSLAYPKVIHEQTVSLSLGSRNSIGTHRNSFNLFAHGRPGIPWVLASISIGGIPVAAVGNVPIQRADNTCWARWLSIGADETYVTAFEYTVIVRTASAYTLSSTSVDITVWITDELL